MVRHIESCKRDQLQEENELLKKQLQEVHKGDRLSILGQQQQQEGPPKGKETIEKQQKEGELQANVEMLTKLLQEQESQAAKEIQVLKQQLQEKEAQMACVASWAIEALKYRKPAKSYALYLKYQWFQFQIKTLTQRGTTPSQNIV